MESLCFALVLTWIAWRAGRAGFGAQLGLLGSPRAACAALVVVVAALASAATAHAMPTRTGWVTDEAHALTPQARQDLDRELDAFTKRTSFEVAVVAVRSLEGKSVEDFGFALAKSWKIGKAGLDNGVLVLVAVDDRKMRIETGKGVGELLTDLESREILDAVMRPKLRAGDTAGALQEGARAVMKKLDRSPQQAAAEARGTGRPWWLWGLGIFGLIGAWRLANEIYAPLAKSWRERDEQKRKIAWSLAEAEKAQPAQQDFDQLLEAFEKEPWASRPILSRSSRAYARAFAQHSDARRKAARAAGERWTEDPLRQATVAGEEAYLARRVFDRLSETFEDDRKAHIRNTFSALDEAYALIAQLDEQKIAHDAAEPLSEAEGLLAEAFQPSGDAPSHLLAVASRSLHALLDTWRGHLEELSGQRDVLAGLARSIEGAEAPIGRGEAALQQFRSDFPAEKEGESPAACLAEARAALAKARASVGVRSGEGITRFNDAAEETTRLLTRARSAADRAPQLAVERAAREPVLAQRLEGLRALLAQLRLLANAPQDAITTADRILHEAERQQGQGDQGSLAAALKDTLRAIQIGESARFAAARDTADTSSSSSGWSSSGSSSSSSSSSYDSGGSSGSSSDGGSSSSSDSGSSSSGGGGDFGGGGASSDW